VVTVLYDAFASKTLPHPTGHDCVNRIAITMFEHIPLPVDMLTVGMNYLKLLVVLIH